MCLKIENCCLKIFIKIRVSKKNILKYIKYCLKIKNNNMKTQAKQPYLFLEFFEE